MRDSLQRLFIRIRIDDNRITVQTSRKTLKYNIFSCICSFSLKKIDGSVDEQIAAY